MGFFNRKTTTKDVVKKSISGLSAGALRIFGSYGGGGTISSQLAYAYRRNVSALGDSVNRISRTVSTIPWRATEEGNVPISLEILNGDFPGINSTILIKELITSQLLTGEMWVILRGDVNRPPVAIDWIYPYQVSVLTFNTSRGLPDQINTSSNIDNKTYRLQTDSGYPRWIDDSGMNEILYYFGEIDSQYQRANPPLDPIQEEIEQLYAGSTHNTNLLKNGATLSGIISPKDGANIHEDDIKQIEKDLTEKFLGFSNAGKMMIMSRGVDFTQLNTSNLDMDYVNLMASSKQAIYGYMGIPLPLVMVGAETYDNYRAARLAFYDDAVFPAAQQLLSFFAQIAIRFGESEVGVEWDPTKIEPLRLRRTVAATALRETGVATPNEVREVLGLDPIDGGDILYIPANLVPIDPSGGASFEDTVEPIDDDTEFESEEEDSEEDDNGSD